MDIATEEFSHLEMVGNMITMLLDGLNDDLKMANERCDWMPAVTSGDGRDQIIHSAAVNPLYYALRGGGGVDVGNAAGVPWSGGYVNSNGDPSVDLRSNLAAESRAKIVYEYLKQFTDDPGVQDTLTFLMTREVAHFQQFTAALNELPVNFPPGQAPGDDRFQNVAFNMSNSDGDGDARGPWNEGQGPWPNGMEWEYVKNPTKDWLGKPIRENKGQQDNPDGTPEVHSEKPFTHEQPTAAG